MPASWGLAALGERSDGAVFLLGTLGSPLVAGPPVQARYRVDGPEAEQPTDTRESVLRVVGALGGASPDFLAGIPSLGATEGTNNQAEIVGASWALLWTLRADPVVEVVIHPDSRLAMDLAVGQARAVSDGSGIGLDSPAAVLRSLALVAEQRHTVRFEHIYGHTGHPWNELADSLADVAARSDLQPPPALVLPCLTGTREEMEWEWLREASVAARAQYPDLLEGFLVDDAPLEPPSTDPLRVPAARAHSTPAQQVPVQAPGEARATTRLRVVSYNVFTLGPEAGDARTQLRAEALAA